jgi:hypothetical protein
MVRLLAIIMLSAMLAGCGGPPVKPCPDPDPDPTGPCATSHSQTHGG